MYRLLKASSLKVNGANLTKFPCSLCNRDYVFIPGIDHFPNKLICRKLTTQELTALKAGISKFKKHKKPKKKFAELVEVNEDSSNVTKARVKNLTPKQISKIAEQPETTLECLHNITKKPSANVLSCNNSGSPTVPKESEKTPISGDKDISLLDNSPISLIDDHILKMEIERELEWESIRRSKEPVDVIFEPDVGAEETTPVQSEPTRVSNNLKKSSIKSKKKPNELEVQKSKILLEKERQFIVEKFNSNLSSFIDLCVHCDYLNIAFGSLNRYSNKNLKKNKVISLRSAHPFNSLMHGYAKKENYDKINELFRMMRSNGISPNPQSYAAAFEALGRLSSDPETLSRLKFLLQEMKTKNYGFQDLFEHCFYTADQREYVLKAVHLLDPSFKPHYNPPALYYNCALLKDLNKQPNKPFHSPCQGLVSDEEMEDFVREQLKIELLSPVKIKSVLQPPKLTEEIIHCRNKWNELQDQWRMSIREALNRDLQMMKTQQNSTKLCYSINIYPYLKALSAEEYVNIMLQEIRKLVQGSETFSPNLKTLQKNLGHQVRLKYLIKHKQQHGVLNKMEKIYKNYCQWYLNPETNTSSLNTRQQWQTLLYANISRGPSLDEKEESWPANIVQEIGRFLYNIIMKDIKTDVNCYRPNATPEYLPAFYSLFRYQGSLLLEELKPHPALVRLYKESMSDDLFFDVNLLPMVSPPIPWTTPKSGGYIVAKADFIRLHYGTCEKTVEETSPQRLYPVFDSLNQLGSIPWRINEPVLDVVLKVFREGGSSKLDIPQHSSSYVPSDLPFDSNQKALTYRQRALHSRKKAEMYGLWCEALYRLSLANHFRNRVFWLPHNMDFRGRVYPVPPHLTHLGNDMARSLLRFAKGEKLGPKGLDWLKIHCINLTGLKKRESTEERLRYANEILPDILDSAENPLTGKMWWAESEEQWQTLACCMAIKEALDSGDPKNHVSYFPVHQDGSCNGLQHYAALGRDSAGAESVNLAPSRIPQDVYSCVVALVEEERVKDAHGGSEIAIALEGFIKRKVIKQTIMTTVYGVTRYGARLQIAKQLKDIDNFPKNLVWPAAGYLTMKTFHCLQEMFTSSREIQDWFTDCAKFISNECGSNVEWQTPLGLPVIQPYSKTKVSKLLNDRNGQLNRLNLDVILKPNALKQKNAFPPNFVHSLDSSHMMLTSLFCEREGITFISVHDCFWTHPRFVDAMNKICRKQFVALHSDPILENLSAFFMKRFSTAYRLPQSFGCELPHEVFTQVPEKGNFDLQEVLKSTYFFS